MSFRSVPTVTTSFASAIESMRAGLIGAELKIVAEIPASTILEQSGYKVDGVYQLLLFRAKGASHG